MGQSTNAMLVYGYHLGGGDAGWELEGVGEYEGLPALDWYDPDDEDSDGFEEAAEKRLLAQLAGFTETDWRADGYFTREREAKARLGIQMKSHCSGDYPMYLLAANVITVYRGSVETIDMAALIAEAEASGWDDKLRAAVQALGVTPTQTEPRWLLCSYWG